MKRQSFVVSLLIVLVVALGFFGFSQRQYLKDYYVVLTTDLEAASAQLAKKLELTDRADFIYQASQTDLQNASEFRNSCGELERHGIVLGCYKAQRVYVYDITEKKLTGIREVTAAHELLHGMYDRLPLSKRTEVNQLLAAQAKNIKDEHVQETLKLYDDVPSDDLYNEMHSIFGTELKDLSPKLEAYYKDYFKNRSRIVSYSNAYQAVFKRLEETANRLKREYTGGLESKQQYEADLNRLQQEIEAEKARLQALRSRNTAVYNQSVPAFNAKVAEYNAILAQYKALITTLNSIVNELNDNITQQNSLTKKLNSNYNSI